MSYQILSIRLSTDGFSFSIHSSLQDEPVAYVNKEVEPSLSLTANLKRAFRDIELLGQEYRQVNVIMVNKRFTLVPLEMFEDDQSETLFYHNHTKKENETVHFNILKKSNAVVVFGMDKSAVQFLSEQYPEAKFYSQASPLIEHFSVKSKLGNNRKMYACVRGNAIDMFCFERGHLMLANSFDCKETPDRIYYLLYLWKQLGLDQERDELHLTGLLTDKEKLVNDLRKFIVKVFVMSPEINIDMQALLSCEL